MPKKNLKYQIAQSIEPILVDFFAEWCGPCKTMDPVIEHSIGEMEGKIRLLKINVDKYPQLSQQFGIRSIPHYILFKRGKILWRKGGLMTKKDLVQTLKGFV
jgi:thioredoxin 1